MKLESLFAANIYLQKHFRMKFENWVQDKVM
jgi:hypothetical protein